MNMEKLLPVRMNAFWFTYIAVFSFALLPNFGPELGFLQIAGVSFSGVLIVNLWALYNEKPIMDERKQGLVTEGMAWAFVVTSLLIISLAEIGTEVNADLLQDIAEMGLWTWLIVFSMKNLYHKYGGI